MKTMHRRNLKNKYISLLSLVVFLFAASCFVPCGMARVEASSQHGEMQGEAGGHSCHSESAGYSFKASGSGDACAHCKIVQSSSLQERSTLADHAQAPILAFSDLTSAKQYFPPLYFVNKSSPPGFHRPIYILNSTFII